MAPSVCREVAGWRLSSVPRVWTLGDFKLMQPDNRKLLRETGRTMEMLFKQVSSVRTCSIFSGLCGPEKRRASKESLTDRAYCHERRQCRTELVGSRISTLFRADCRRAIYQPPRRDQPMHQPHRRPAAIFSTSGSSVKGLDFDKHIMISRTDTFTSGNSFLSQL
jgi:hypothetical protein